MQSSEFCPASVPKEAAFGVVYGTCKRLADTPMFYFQLKEIRLSMQY